MTVLTHRIMLLPLGAIHISLLLTIPLHPTSTISPLLLLWLLLLTLLQASADAEQVVVARVLLEASLFHG